MKIVTFNLRCEWCGADGANDFVHRAGFIYNKIRCEQPSVIAFQEVVPQSLELLKRTLTEYEFFGGMRTAELSDEGLYIAFRREEFHLLGADVFWLSPTPYVPGSRFPEQSFLPRIGVYVRLAVRESREIFHFFDLHLDCLSPQTASLGLRAALAYIDSRSDCIDTERTVIMGDFNIPPDSPALAPLAERNWLYDATHSVGGSYHAFGTRKNQEGEREDMRIDYIIASCALRDRIAEVSPWQDEKNGIYLSDHYPICATIQ